jgi:uncharacterized protein YciI
MKYAAIIVYTPDKAKIQAVRPAHREYLTGKKAEGKIALAGPLQDDAGAIIVYAADSPGEAEEIVRNDPFAKEGVFVSWEIKPWNLLLCNRDLLPA